ncbi:MAG: hypothetical protein ACPIOQ_57595, partial [Promethearchaeia archaeon]
KGAGKAAQAEDDEAASTRVGHWIPAQAGARDVDQAADSESTAARVRPAVGSSAAGCLHCCSRETGRAPVASVSGAPVVAVASWLWDLLCTVALLCCSLAPALAGMLGGLLSHLLQRLPAAHVLADEGNQSAEAPNMLQGPKRMPDARMSCGRVGAARRRSAHHTDAATRRIARPSPAQHHDEDRCSAERDVAPVQLLQVFLESWQGKTYFRQLPANTKVGAVQLEFLRLLPPGKQPTGADVLQFQQSSYLQSKGNILRADKTLAECGIRSRDTIRLVMRLRGGGACMSTSSVRVAPTVAAATTQADAAAPVPLRAPDPLDVHPSAAIEAAEAQAPAGTQEAEEAALDAVVPT